MADSNNNNSNAWPLPKFRFEVDFGTDLTGIAFQEISGLESDSGVIEYRAGNSPLFSTVKMPGILKHGNVIMKKGVFKNDSEWRNWCDQVKTNTNPHNTVTIKLLDEEGKAIMRWTLRHVALVKFTTVDLKSNGTEVAVESMELAHDCIRIDDSK